MTAVEPSALLAAAELNRAENSNQRRPADSQIHSSIWSRFKKAIVKTDQEFSIFKGLSFVGFLSTLLVAYFQYLSAYQDKVSTQAKEDLTAATAAFTEASNAFSTAMTLQQILFYDYRYIISKGLDGDDKAMETKNAREIYSSYDSARTALRQNIDVLARKMEIYIDWPSDLNRDPAKDAMLGADPMSRPMLGAYNFDCDKYMPDFSAGNSGADLPVPAKTLKENPKLQPLHLDWYSAKHHVLALHYCFETAHAALEIARAWASNSSVDAGTKTKFVERDSLKTVQNDLDQQVLRLNAFMTLAMRRLEDIRVKYRPTGFFCHVPVIREVIGAFGARCRPIRTAEN